MRYGDFDFRDRPRGRFNRRPRMSPHRYGSQYDATPYDRPGRPDYWWIGEHATRGGAPMSGYDDDYSTFDRLARPRYSPVGGMYHAMGGTYSRRPPRPLREPTRFSEWTRWF